jgi:predicted Zn-ribbon and HTH transcriptional regulator
MPEDLNPKMTKELEEVFDEIAKRFADHYKEVVIEELTQKLEEAEMGAKIEVEIAKCTKCTWQSRFERHRIECPRCGGTVIIAFERAK